MNFKLDIGCEFQVSCVVTLDKGWYAKRAFVILALYNIDGS